MDRMPVGVVREDLGADIVIGVDVGHRGQRLSEPESRRDVIMKTFDIMAWEIAKRQQDLADFVITPAVKAYPFAHLAQADECVELGRKSGTRSFT